MGLDDIPAQIGRVVRFSVRSTTSFVLSFVTAAFVIGFAADLLYGFVYTRVFNVKDALYPPLALALLAAAAFGIPLAAGLYAGIRAWRDTRPFDQHKFSVAIAPFEVFSLDPDILGTPSKKQGLEDTVSQFFAALRVKFRERAWYDEFVFRSLPPFVRVANKAHATARRGSLSASLLIWGTIIQKVSEPLFLRINLCSTGTDLEFSGPFDPMTMADIFAYFLLTAVAYAKMGQGDPAAALNLYDNAREFCDAIDKIAKSTTHSERLAVWREEARVAVEKAANR